MPARRAPGSGWAPVTQTQLDGLQRALVTQPQRLGVPRIGVARAQLAEQRRELPAQLERDGDDDESQRARRSAGGGGRERLPGVVALAVQQALEGRALRGVGRRCEYVGHGPPGELLGGRAEQRDDADAAFGDRAVGGAQDVAAVRQPEQHLLDVVICGGGCGQLLAQDAHGWPIGRGARRLSEAAPTPRDVQRTAARAATLRACPYRRPAIRAASGDPRGPCRTSAWRSRSCTSGR